MTMNVAAKGTFARFAGKNTRKNLSGTIRRMTKKRIDKVARRCYGDAMIRTKLTVEIEAHTQFGPETAVKMVGYLLKVPAISEVKITAIDSDWKSTPQTFPEDVNLRTILSLPIKL